MSLIVIMLICSALLAVMCWLLFAYGEGGYHTRHMLAGIAGLLCGFAAALALCATAAFSYGWFAAEHQVAIINREYGTTYTRAEVFYASSVIDTVRELQRQRIEVNGDLLSGEVE